VVFSGVETTEHNIHGLVDDLINSVIFLVNVGLEGGEFCAEARVPGVVDALCMD
jgi:hypothetical protein